MKRITEADATLITKDVATKILNMNSNNRRVKAGNLKLIEHELKNGLFSFNGESIIIGKSGILLDGQHRLIAVENTGIPIKSIIVYDVDDSAFSTIDTGASRTSADVLSIDGFANYAVIAKVSKMMLLYERGENNINGRDKSYRTSNKEILEFVNKHNELLQDSISEAFKFYNKSRILTLSEILFYYIVFKKDDSLMCENFMNELFKGISSSEHSAPIVLRNKLTEIKMNKNISLSQSVKADYIFKAWNKYKNKEEIKFIRISPKEKVKRPSIIF